MKKITLFLFLLASCMTSPGQTTEPLLRLNSEMHTSRISRMSMDAGGNRILTVSRDKTAKLWDAATGDLLMTFHPPIDKDGEGMLYAGALSPDGVIAAVGGWTGYKWDNSHSIYLFNANSGEMIQRLTGLGNVVTDLEFSIQGEYLAAAQGAGEGVRIYKHDHAGGFTFSLEKTLSGYESASYNICFSPSGNMVSACDDGYIRLYSNSFELIKKTKGSGQESFSVAFSPDGSKIAVGYYDVREVEVFDAVTLGLLYRPELGEMENEGNFYCVSFSADGECLFGGGSYPEYIDGNWWYIIRRWDRGGRGSYTDYPVCDNIIMDIKPVPLHNGKQGGVIFAGTLPDFGRIDQYGNMQFYKAGKVFSMNVTDRAHLKTESTGDVIAFKPNGEDAMMFSVSDRRLNPFEQLPGMESYTDQRGSISVGDWEDSYKPVINGEATGFLRQSELCRSVDISPYGDKIVCGANWSIYCTDGKGEKLWKTSIQSNAWAVNISQNSKTVVASMGEGIINWYRMKDGKLLLTLYINPDDRRWVLFTPEGYYDAAPGAEDLIGWHLNDGSDTEAYFFPASKFRNKYYRPDVIDNILETYDEGDALRIADLQNNRKSNDTKIANMLPPVVRILSPSHRQEVGSENLTIRYTAKSPNGEPVTAVKVMIDGRPVSNQRGFKPMHDETGEITIQIPQKDATIQLLAENRHGWSTRAEVAVKWKGSDNKPDVLKPTLYLLAIGVSDYKNNNLDLKYAAKDAGDFVQTMRQQKGGLYKEVKVKLLTDGNATRNDILVGLEWIEKETTNRDMAMIFIAGHGVNDNKGTFYYLPWEADLESMRSTCLMFTELKYTTSSIAGKVVAFIDACHSGGAMGGRRAPDVNNLVNELSDVESGAVVFTSSTGKQYSLENEKWENGAFTKALIEGLNGKADLFNKGKITIKSLDAYIAERVKELTKGQQTPTAVIPQSISDFPIGVVR